MHLFKSIPTVVSLGGSTLSRVNNRKIVAESKVSIHLSNPELKDRCLKQLEISDQRLANDPSEPQLPYDWQIVLSESFEDGSSVVHFGVAWYDIDFFKEKKEVFTDPRHTKIFDSIGVSTNDVSVDHWVKA